MHIVADENIPLADAFFSHLGTVERLPGRSLTREHLQRADLLLVRSVTAVNAELLADTPVKFVASATIGTDHVDLELLRQRGIGFSNAPGCNADSVVDYVLSAFTHLAQQQGCALFERRVGIVGVGNVGRRLQQRLQRLGIECLLCDPPRAEQEAASASGSADRFVDLSELLRRCDVFCLHTPLTREGRHSSYHLFDAERLHALPQGSWLINAGRGAVIDNRALAACLQQRKDLQVVLDVWESEPAIDTDLAQQVTLATPHIAGYSLEGKSRGTEMIYQSACRFLGLVPQRTLDQLLPAPAIRQLDLNAEAALEIDLLPRLVKLVYDLRRDHEALMLNVRRQPSQMGCDFDRLRRYYPERREFSSLRIAGLVPGSPLAAQLSGYGFTLDKEALDKEALDQETLDQETLDQEALDKEALDQEALDKEAQRGPG
ncbi:MAG: erythronate-4-phosphate dehydrogenase [Motiliproteus sp.]|jgi:erythronate-4-phosphate dehydrogenase